jgi:hypothetical protein
MLNLRGRAPLSDAILNGLINLSISSVLSVFIKVGLTQMLLLLKLYHISLGLKTQEFFVGMFSQSIVILL